MRTAAFLLLLLLSPAFSACGGSDRRPVERPPAAPEPLTPRGPTETPFVFSWRASPGETPVYRVRVTDAAERVLYEQDVRATQCPPTSELKNMMDDHATFRWTVAVLSGDGTKEVARSAPVEFALK